MDDALVPNTGKLGAGRVRPSDTGAEGTKVSGKVERCRVGEASDKTRVLDNRLSL